MKLWAWDERNLPSIAHAVRTAIAVTVSVIIARLMQMPEVYWAAIATLVVMQSTLGTTLTLSIERIVATAVGASVWSARGEFCRRKSDCVRGCNYFHRIALDCVSSGETAYRYASITLAIIVLIPRTAPAWTMALHRFLEVSVGIIVALAIVALWPEHQRSMAKSVAESLLTNRT